MELERTKVIYKGILVSNIFSLLVLGASKYLILKKPESDLITTMMWTEFIIIPLAMGIISSWYWKNLNFRTRNYVGYSVLNGLVAIILSFIFLNEGVICLLIVSPLIFIFVLCGTLIGKRTFKAGNSTFKFSLVGLMITLFLVDMVSEHRYENVVSDSIIINASPGKIWNNVVAFEEIKTPNSYWLFNLGMPSPSETTVDGYYQGAGRKCVFSNGYVFDERMTIYKPNENLTFDIIHQPRDPEIMGHIDILRGQFLLKDNGNGTTTLVGNSWYRLYVFPTWYYDIWAVSITRNVHLRVMHHIKELSED